MGGLFGGGGGKSPVVETYEKATAAEAAKSEPTADTVEARESGEERAARRRVRRGGRALLSDARLNPEQGVSTLGQTGL